MSHFHLNFSLELIALGLGALILVWSKMPEKPGMSFARLIGYIIIILTILNMICTVTVAVKFWNSGYFYRLHPMMMQQEMMIPCPMMQKRMNQQRMMMQDSMMQQQATPQNPANQQETMMQGEKPMMQNPPSSAPNEMMQNQQPAQEAMPQNRMDQKGAVTENPTMTNQEENKT
jgi:NhaP-type Na+/H+ and K+/H+ antiporter